MMRLRKNAIIGLVMAAALALTMGCQKKEAAPAAAEKAAPAEETTSAEKKIKAGFVYVGPAGDLGFSYAHDQARLELEKEMPWLETKIVESVPEGKAATVLDQLVQNEKCDIIFTASFGFMDETVAAAAKYPNVKFEHCSGFKLADNLGTYFADLYQMYYLDGLLAGALSKTGKIGYVGAFPIPEVVRHINAYALGVKAANPKAKVDVRWISAWYDPAKAREAALALIASGCDALAFTEDTAAVVEVGQEQWKAGKKIYTFGHYSPMADKGPDSLVSGQLVNWTPIYRKILTDLHDGNWKSEDYFWLAAENAVDLGGKVGEPISPKFIDELKGISIATPDLGKISAYDLVLKRFEQMKKTPVEFEPFTGPIKDQKGVEKYAAGVKASLADLTSINWFVSNVVGKLE
jgi:simple sugar transport system substrate-binding protein